MFGEKLQALLDDNDISQSKLANELDVTSQAVSKWCNNLAQPDHETLIKIANKFNVSIDYLLGNELNDKTIDNMEENKELLSKVSTEMQDPTMKALYSKASELKNERDRRMVLNVINSFIEDVDNRDN